MSASVCLHNCLQAQENIVPFGTHASGVRASAAAEGRCLKNSRPTVRRVSWTPCNKLQHAMRVNQRQVVANATFPRVNSLTSLLRECKHSLRVQAAAEGRRLPLANTNPTVRRVSWTATNKLWLTAMPCEPTFVADVPAVNCFHYYESDEGASYESNCQRASAAAEGRCLKNSRPTKQKSAPSGAL